MEKDLKKMMKKDSESKKRKDSIENKVGEHFKETGLKTAKDLRKNHMMVKKIGEDQKRKERRSERFLKKHDS